MKFEKNELDYLLGQMEGLRKEVTKEENDNEYIFEKLGKITRVLMDKSNKESGVIK